MSYVVGIIFLLLVWFIFKFLLGAMFYEDEFHKQFKEEANELEYKRKKRCKRTGDSITYDEFVDSLKNEFKMPKDIICNIEELKDPIVSKKRLNSFIEWIRSKDSDLLAAITSSKSLALVIPELVIDVTHTTITNGSIRSPELDDNFDAYCILDWLCYASEKLSDHTLVKLLNYEKIDITVASKIFGEEGSWYEGSWCDYQVEMSEAFYTKDEGLEVPENFGNYFEGATSGGSFSGPVADGEETLYCTINVNYQDKKIIINGSGFKFKKDEKEHLITLLIASYKPSLLKRIKEGLR